jgi:hypothetical protein
MRATPSGTRARLSIRPSLSWMESFSQTTARSVLGPVIEAEDVQPLAVYTAGFPAEYGRKRGGVVEVNTLQDSQCLTSTQ